MALGKTSAMQQLQIRSVRQLDKLLATGTLPSLRPTDVARLAGWAPLELQDDEHGIAVHVGPYKRQDADYSKSRRWYGWEVGNRYALSPADIERAWVGDWAISEENANEAIGGYLVADIAGFIPGGLVRRINDYTSISTSLGRRMVFHVSVPGPHVLNRFEEHRFRSRPGQFWQWQT